MKKNILLLGASNSRIPGGLQAGLSQGYVNLYNLSIGGTDCVHKIYELHKEKNKDLILKSDLIILEVNLMDVTMSFMYKKITFKVVKYIHYLYRELSFLKKKILILLLFDLRCINDNQNKSANLITNIHEKLSIFYNFNLINLHKRMITTRCFQFYTTFLDPYHLLSTIMFQLGQNIAKSIDKFIVSKTTDNQMDDIIFKVVSPVELLNNTKIRYVKDLIYDDEYVEIADDDLIYFPKRYFGYKILGIHTFFPMKKGISHLSMCTNYFSLIFRNSKKQIVKSFRIYNNFDWIYDDFIIDEEVMISYNKNNIQLTEVSNEVIVINNSPNTLSKACIVNFLLIQNDLKFIPTVKSSIFRYQYKYDFSYLIPPIEIYKEVIEEYILKTNITNTSLTQQISYLKTFSTAKQRIQNQLSYKLGQAMIVNSKSFLGYVRMPFVLSYIKD
ncbi:hypothetical protein CINS5881_05125, partial [Campylobacter insulaenigrae]|nr:hypothetical protein [Campylobacter insulaenigrae]MCR6586457.1 hypothetical protein [Campylobacter insulaenigrae]